MAECAQNMDGQAGPIITNGIGHVIPGRKGQGTVPPNVNMWSGWITNSSTAAFTGKSDSNQSETQEGFGSSGSQEIMPRTTATTAK